MHVVSVAIFMPRPRARAREGVSTALLMPGTGKSCAASSRKQLCKQKSLQRLTRLAERLGAPSGRVCIFLLSTLRSRASSGYIRALLDFSNDMPPSWRARTSEEKDLWLCDFVLEQLEENVPPSRLRTLLAALQKIGLGKFRMPWRVLEGWTTLLPPTQAAALPEAVLRAFCSILVASHEHVVATVLVLCYFGVLRVSEALRLSPADVYFVDGAVLLYLARTKRGMEETVFVQDVFVARWLRWYLATSASSKLPNVFLPCSYCRIQRQLEFCSAHLGLSTVRFTSHSCRRGGATRLYMRNWPIESIALFGRWKNVRSCHEYLRRGEVFLMRLRGEASNASWDLVDVFSDGVWRVWRVTARQLSVLGL